MNKLMPVLLTGSVLFATAVTAAPESTARAQFQSIMKLEGDWVLSSADRQEGKATRHKLVAPLVGTDDVAMTFKVIGKGSAIQENLLPGNGKEMATMYRCDDTNLCQRVLATHYCAKKNQPEFVADVDKSDRTISLSCDMSTALCNSNEEHVHKITHELTGDNHLKTSYTLFKDGKFRKNSIYHFDRANNPVVDLATLEPVKKGPDCVAIEGHFDYAGVQEVTCSAK